MIAIYSLKLGGKFYIGSSSNVEKRCREHFRLLKNDQHHSKKLQNSCNELRELPIFEIVEELETTENMFNIEEKYINLYDSYNNGYNSTPKALGTCPEDFTQERKDNISKTLKGKTPWNKGISMTDEQKLKLKETQTNKKGKPVDVYSLDGELLFKFNSVSDCYKSLDLDKRSVQRALKKEYSKFKDMIFEYSGNVPDLTSIKKSTGNSTTYKVVVDNLNEKFVFNNLVETSNFLFPDSTFTKKYLAKLVRNAIRDKTLINNYQVYKLE